jgi:uncharacterized protein (DUF1778 family)
MLSSRTVSPALSTCKSAIQQAAEKLSGQFLRRWTLQNHLRVAQDFLQRQRALVLKWDAKIA